MAHSTECCLKLNLFKNGYGNNPATVRRHITYLIVGAFVAVNVLTYLGIGWIYRIDQAELSQHVVTPTQRIITTEIVATAVGATTVQLGFLAVLIGRYLFPRAHAVQPRRFRQRWPPTPAPALPDLWESQVRRSQTLKRNSSTSPSFTT